MADLRHQLLHGRRACSTIGVGIRPYRQKELQAHGCCCFCAARAKCPRVDHDCRALVVSEDSSEAHRKFIKLLLKVHGSSGQLGQNSIPLHEHHSSCGGVCRTVLCRLPRCRHRHLLQNGETSIYLPSRRLYLIASCLVSRV